MDVYTARLMACGYTKENATEAVNRYKDDPDHLEWFVSVNESLYDDRKEYPKED